MTSEAYQADRSISGKLRRRWARLHHRRPLSISPGRPIISFSFDDAPLTSTTSGAEILERRNLRGTYYVSAALAGREAPTGVCGAPADYLRLCEAGHEIACHTHNHLDLGRSSAEDAAADVAQNLAAFTAWGLPRPQSFAYPYGDLSVQPKRAISGQFTTLRGLHHGLIERGCDMNQAPAVGIEGQDGEASARGWMSAAKSRNAWLILYTHDVQQDPSPWGCTPKTLETLVDLALADGFEVMTVASAAQALGL